MAEPVDVLPGDIVVVPREQTLNVTIESNGHRHGFTAHGDGPAVVASFRSWLERLYIAEDPDGTDRAAVRLTEALEELEVKDRKAPGMSKLCRRILAEFFPDHRKVEPTLILARLEDTTPSKITAALQEAERLGILELVTKHGGYDDAWRRRKE